MNAPTTDNDQSLFEPRWPTLTATVALSLWVAVLSLPMLSGQFLAGPYSDQHATGYAFRTWGAEQLRLTHHLPLWNPNLFGGLPFVAAMHGDIFYPTSWLRYFWSMPTVMHIGFVLHYLIAGLATYAFLRMLRIGWTGATLGGLAYQLAGLIASYPSPGHDGKLFVTALLPLAFIALLLAIRDLRPAGYPLLALVVGLALLSPHYQMTYYLLIASGLFALYLTFGEPTAGRSTAQRVTGLGLALAAVLLGFGIAMIQVLPFFHYIPYSPRAEGATRGYAWASSYAIPWAHVPELFLSGFAGTTMGQTYWGPNGLKLHSEYLGLPVIVLAILGLRDQRRRLVYWLGGMGVLFFFIALGGSTPFYRLWYELVPYARQTRAPGMALYVVAFILAIFAAMGTERLERRLAPRAAVIWLASGAAVVLLAVSGVFGALASALAAAVQSSTGLPSVQAAQEAQGAIMSGAALSGLALLLVAGLAFLAAKGRLGGPLLAAGLLLVVSGDLYRNARPFWIYSHTDRDLFQRDAVTTRLGEAPRPLRVLEYGVYPPSALMAFGIPTVLGYHGNEIRFFDELWGGQGEWKNAGNPGLWNLYAVNYVVLPADGRTPDSIPGYRKTVAAAATTGGVQANLFERIDPFPYARVVSAAVKLPDDQAIKSLTAGRQFQDQVVLLNPSSTLATDSLAALPPPSATRATVTHWEPGRMQIQLDPAPAAPSYLVVGENYYPDWQATVDGTPGRVDRGDVALITVPVGAGARSVELTFRSADYERGKMVSVASIGLLLAWLGAASLRRRAARV
ncbi:MAG: hypothetical protein ACHQ2E_01865 [Gemmatimonadales bacterium]